MGTTGFLCVIYLCFVGVMNWVSFFLHFPLNPVLNYFWGESGFYPFFFFSLLLLVLCDCVVDMLVGGFSHLFSFPLFNFCVVAVLAFI
jgi:hypothetical protein